MKITTYDLVRRVAAKSGYFIKDIEHVMNAFDEVISDIMSEVTSEEPMEVRIATGITLGCKIMPERQGLNPQTHEWVMLPATVKPYVKYSDTYRDNIRAIIDNDKKG